MVFSGKNLASLTVPLNAAIHVVNRQTSLGDAAAHFPHLPRVFFLHHWLFIPGSCCPGYSWAWESHVARKSKSATEAQGRGGSLVKVRVEVLQTKALHPGSITKSMANLTCSWRPAIEQG